MREKYVQVHYTWFETAGFCKANILETDDADFANEMLSTRGGKVIAYVNCPDGGNRILKIYNPYNLIK
jgi:hypothetical protein